MSTPNFDARYATPAQVDSKIATQATTDAGQYGPFAIDGLTKSDLNTILCIGDSITYGGQDQINGYSYPGLLANSLAAPDGAGPTIINAGKSGWTSTDIAIQVGAQDVTLGAFTIPTSTAYTTVTVTAPTGAWQANGTGGAWQWIGVLNVGGTLYSGTLRHNVSLDGSWSFKVTTTPGSTINVPAGSVFHCTMWDNYRAATAIIMVGRNNISNQSVVIGDIANIIAHLSPNLKRYLVLSITTSSQETSGSAGYTSVTSINAALAATYGNRYVDVRGYLIQSGLSFNGLTATTADATAISSDTIPPQLVIYDNLHPNYYGYRAIARAVLDRIVALGWAPSRTPSPIPSPAYPYSSGATNIYTDSSFELGTATFFQRQNTNSTAARSSSASRTGSYGVRVSFSGANTGQAIDFYTSCDTTITYSGSAWVRSSKQVTLTLGLLYYTGAYGTYQGTTITSSNYTIPANTWTKMTISGYPGPAGGVLALSVLNDGQSWALGDTLDIDDIYIVRGSATP